MKTFEIYFSDLNEDAQKRLLDAAGAESAADMNLDMDTIPIAWFDFEEIDKDDEEIVESAGKLTNNSKEVITIWKK